MTAKRFILFTLLTVQSVPGWALTDVKVVRDGTTLTVSWSSAKPVDVYVADSPSATLARAKAGSRADSDGQFILPDAGTVRRYFLLREKGSKAVVQTAERLVPLEKGSNFRDIGGYTGAGGKQIRWGMIYRSGATPVLTEADLAQIKALGLRAMVDLRSREERVLAPSRIDGVEYQSVGYSMMSMMRGREAMTNGGNLYRNFPTFFAPQLRVLFDDLLGKKGPVAYNCSAGQDRTGFATAMILSALGVPRATILEDYHLSTQYRRPENELPKITPAMAEADPVARMFAAYQSNGTYTKPTPLRDPDGKAFLEGAFDEIEKRWGSVDAYLAKEVGIGPREIAQLRAAYLQ